MLRTLLVQQSKKISSAQVVPRVLRGYATEAGPAKSGGVRFFLLVTYWLWLGFYGLRLSLLNPIPRRDNLNDVF